MPVQLDHVSPSHSSLHWYVAIFRYQQYLIFLSSTLLIHSNALKTRYAQHPKVSTTVSSLVSQYPMIHSPHTDSRKKGKLTQLQRQYKSRTKIVSPFSRCASESLQGYLFSQTFEFVWTRAYSLSRRSIKGEVLGQCSRASVAMLYSSQITHFRVEDQIRGRYCQ
jgi:hypothetical protein